MKIFWYSPLLPAQAELAQYSRRVVGALSSWLSVECVVPDGARTGKDMPARTISAVSERELNSADACVYNIGLASGADTQIAMQALARPGVVVLHQAGLHPLFWQLSRQRLGGGIEHLKRLVRWYGAPGLRAGLALGDAERLDGELARRFALFEPMVHRSMGVVCHDRQVAAAVRALFPKLAVLELPPPFVAGPQPPLAPAGRAAGKGKAIRLALAGGALDGPVALALLSAWAQCEARGQFAVQVAGGQAGFGRFKAAAKALKLARQITCHRLALTERPLDGVDLLIDLGDPAGLPDRLMRGWAAGVPMALCAGAGEGDWPADSVYPIAPQTAQADILELLTRLQAGRLDLAGQAACGLQALARHDPAVYARRLADWLHQGQAARARAWAETALVETAARAIGESTPAGYAPRFPASLIM